METEWTGVKKLTERATDWEEMGERRERERERKRLGGGPVSSCGHWPLLHWTTVLTAAAVAATTVATFTEDDDYYFTA